jgi:hypothetical protein
VSYMGMAGKMACSRVLGVLYVGTPVISCGTLIEVLLVCIAINIALMVWLGKDAKARSSDSSAMWMLAFLFFGVFALVMYLVVRPGGRLVRCKSCGKQRLEGSAKCPHCFIP